MISSEEMYQSVFNNFWVNKWGKNRKILKVFKFPQGTLYRWGKNDCKNT